MDKLNSLLENSEIVGSTLNLRHGRKIENCRVHSALSSTSTQEPFTEASI